MWFAEEWRWCAATRASFGYLVDPRRTFLRCRTLKTCVTKGSVCGFLWAVACPIVRRCQPIYEVYFSVTGVREA